MYKQNKIMKLLKSSNYNNKEVINYIKTSFSIMESSNATFHTSEFIEIGMLKVSKKNDIYTVELSNVKSEDLCSVWSDVRQFESRTKAIKFILVNLGIISKKELNNN